MIDFKKFFPIFQNNPNVIFLDSGASAQKPEFVINAMNDFYKKDYANIHRGLYNLSQVASSLYDEARDKVKLFIGAKYKEEIVFTKGTTEAINLLAYSFSKILKKGDVVFLTELEHHANLIPWQEVAKYNGIVLKFIPILDNGELDYDWFENNISSEVKLVCMSGQSNVIGLKNDIERVVRVAHNFGAKVIIDGAQLISHFKIDVESLNVDFLAFSGHKIYGPTGIGVLYGKKELLDMLPPYQVGGDMVEKVSFDKTIFKKTPEKFEAGTPPIVEAIGLGYAIDFLNEFSMDFIEKEAFELTKYAIEKIADVKNVRLISHKNSNAVISFVVDGVSSFDIASFLAMKNICVRVGKHCAEPLHNKLGIDSSIRLSLGIYNDKRDIDIFVNELEHTISLILGK